MQQQRYDIVHRLQHADLEGEKGLTLYKACVAVLKHATAGRFPYVTRGDVDVAFYGQANRSCWSVGDGIKATRYSGPEEQAFVAVFTAQRT